MKYIVQGRKLEFADMEVEAESRNEAVVAFKASHPDFDPMDIDENVDDGDSWSIHGQCEATGEYIFGGDDYVTDPEDGLTFLRKNLPPDGEGE